MQDNLNKNIRLVVEGVESEQWDSVTIDSQIDVPADGWGLTLFNTEGGVLPDNIQGGKSAQLYYGNELVLTGIIDRVNEAVTRNGVAIGIAGRDFGGQLLDCSVPILTAQSLNFREIIEQFVIGNLSPFAELKLYQDLTLDELEREKITVEPGESIYDVLAKSAATAGQHVWFDPDGTLRIGDPFSNAGVNVDLKLMRHGHGNNILGMDYEEDVSRVFNEIRILGQGADAQQLLAQGTAKTPYKFPRLKIISMGDIETQADAQSVLNKIIHDNDLEAYSLTATIMGWTASGHVWQPGWQVTVKTDASKRANAQWVVMGRTLKLSRTEGKTTILKLRRKGDWTQPLIYKDKKQDDSMSFDSDGRGTYTGASQ